MKLEGSEEQLDSGKFSCNPCVLGLVNTPRSSKAASGTDCSKIQHEKTINCSSIQWERGTVMSHAWETRSRRQIELHKVMGRERAVLLAKHPKMS